MRRKHTLFVLVVAFALLSAGCGLFRKKNRCNECPKWNYMEVETPKKYRS